MTAAFQATHAAYAPPSSGVKDAARLGKQLARIIHRLLADVA